MPRWFSGIATGANQVLGDGVPLALRRRPRVESLVGRVIPNAPAWLSERRLKDKPPYLACTLCVAADDFAAWFPKPDLFPSLGTAGNFFLVTSRGGGQILLLPAQTAGGD